MLLVLAVSRRWYLRKEDQNYEARRLLGYFHVACACRWYEAGSIAWTVGKGVEGRTVPKVESCAILAFGAKARSVRRFARGDVVTQVAV